MLSEEWPWPTITQRERLRILMLERFGDIEALQEEVDQGWNILPPPRGRSQPQPTRERTATTRPMTDTPPVTSSRSSKMQSPTNAPKRSTGAPYAETFTRLFRLKTSNRWEEKEMATYNIPDKLFRKYTQSKHFSRLKRDSTFVAGVGPTHPKLMIVVGVPFDDNLILGGQNMNIVASMLYGATRLQLRDCYVTALVKAKCDPTEEEAWESVDFLRKEVMHYMPGGGVILLLGALALYAVDDEATIESTHGVPIRRGSWTFLPTFHPGYVAQHPSLRQTVLEDYAVLGTILKDHLSPSAASQ